VDCPSWRSALVGSLMAGMPAWLKALGVTYTVEPSAGASPPSIYTFT
jgi:hypothetical protein